MIKKIIIFFLVIIFLLLSLVVIKLFQNKYNEQATAKQPQNFLSEYEDNLIKFQYPTTLTKPTEYKYNISDKAVREYPTRSNLVKQIKLYNKISKDYWDKQIDAVEGGPDHISISIYKNINQLDPEKWIVDQADTAYTNYEKQEFEKFTFLKNVYAIKYMWYGLGGADEIIFTDSKKEFIYRIAANFLDEKSTIRGDLWYIVNSFQLK